MLQIYIIIQILHCTNFATLLIGNTRGNRGRGVDICAGPAPGMIIYLQTRKLNRRVQSSNLPGCCQELSLSLKNLSVLL